MSPKPVHAFLFWAAAVFLAVTVVQNSDEAAAFAPAEPTDPLSRFAGSAKEALGDTLFLKADNYFHGGVAEEEHGEDLPEDLQKEGVLHEENEPVQEAPQDWIASVNRQILVHEHRHLNKEKRKEMLPFFAMAAALDPHNVEAVLTTAYWLENEFGKPEDAKDLLIKGVRDNPSSWEIENALAFFYFRRKEWPEAERRSREAARKSASGALADFQRVDLYYHLAEACLAQEKKQQALEAYEEASRSFGPKTTPFLQSLIRAKIKELSGAQ